MHLKIKLICILTLAAQFVSAQSKYWDNLNPELKTYKQRDSVKVNLLLNATWYYSVRDYNKSIPLIEEAIQISVEQNYIKGLARAKVAYAEYYLENGDFEKANEYVLKAIPVLKNIKDSFYLNEALLIAAKLEQKFKNFEKGLDSLLVLYKKTLLNNANDFQKAKIEVAIADFYMSTKSKDYYKAKVYIIQADKKFKKINSKTGATILKYKFSRFYKNKVIFYTKNSDSNLKKSLSYANAFLEESQKLNQKNNIASAYYNLGLINSVSGNHKNSIPYYYKAIELYNQLGNLYKAMKIYQHLFIAYSILNNQEDALLTNRLFNKLKDSIFNIEKQRLIIDAQTKFDTEKIAAEKRLAVEKNNKITNIYLGSIVIAVLLILSALFYFGRFKAQKEAEISKIALKEAKRRLELEKKFKNSELKALKSQMNPHFIFNALNSIQEYILTNKKNLAGDYLGKFADLIRNYLKFSEEGKISVCEEISILNLYLDLEKLRFEDSLIFSIEKDDSINCETTYIPTMIIQPYIENALKHGLLHKEGKRKLLISISKAEENYLKCIVQDNGIGREKSKKIKEKSNRKHKSFALKATQERLELLNYEKNNKIYVEIQDILDSANIIKGTKAILKIPIIK